MKRAIHYFMHHHYFPLVMIVSLIGVLSFGAYNLLIEGKSRVEDRARIEGLESVRAALEIFYNDYGTYPKAVGHSVDSNDNTIASLTFEKQQTLFPQMTSADDVTALTTLLYGGYLTSLPVDPNRLAGSHFVYAYYVAGEVTPTGTIPNQYYQLNAKFGSGSLKEIRSNVLHDGGDDRDDTDQQLYEIGNAVDAISVSKQDWELMLAPENVDLNVARRANTPSALGEVLPGRKLDATSLQGIYW